MLQGDDYDEKLAEKKSSASQKEEFIPAEEGADGPIGSERAFLKSRQDKVDLESKVGKVQIVPAGQSESGSAAPGWWCEVCQCLLKDSISYLDHINGKRRMLIAQKLF